MILTAVTACDNVEWGGTSVRLRPPPAKEPAPDTTPAAEPESVPLPSGPVLYRGTTTDSGMRLVPVAELTEGALTRIPFDEGGEYRTRFADAFLAPGNAFVLFSGGARVGRFTSNGAGEAVDICVLRPTAVGVAELIPDAADLDEVLALPVDVAGDEPYRSFAPLGYERREGQASLNFAAMLLRQQPVEWPNPLSSGRVRMRGFDLGVEGGRGFAATFLYRDRLRVQTPDPTAWALFVLGTDELGPYDTAYTLFNRARDGRAVPRLVELADWDGDGRFEILLEFLGEDERWNAALDDRGDGWEMTFEDACADRARRSSAP